MSPDSTSTYLIFKIDMPFLRSLSLAYFREVDTALAMEFFERHPSIEYLDVAVNYIDNYWFASELPHNFLPNLRHLRVSGLCKYYINSLTISVMLGTLERCSIPRTHHGSADQSFYPQECECTNTLPPPFHSSEWTTEAQEFGYWSGATVVEKKE